jgi:SAM-dependent methyltransferase
MDALMGGVKKKVKSWVIDNMFSYSGGNYQRDRYPEDKFKLICSQMDLPAVNNVFDIGCNEGYVAAKFSELGKFAVGVDVGPYYLNHVLRNVDQLYGASGPALGVFPLDRENVSNIPEFDVILLLSVHHQWVKKYGDDYARDLVRALISKSRKYFVIEFASTLHKYGYSEPHFVDNDEGSVRAYAESWLESLGVGAEVKYLGKNRETAGTEPYRFIYMLTTG